MSNSKDNPTLRRQLDRAIRLNRDGHSAEAAKILRALAKTSPDSAAVHGYLGGIHLDRERFADAARSFRAAVRLAPTSELASLGLFHSLWALGDKAGALAEMGRFLARRESREYRTLIKELHLTPIVEVRQTPPAALAS